MSDLPTGEGFAKRPEGAPPPEATHPALPQPEGAAIMQDMEAIAAAMARLEVSRGTRAFIMLASIERQLREMNYYLRVLAEGKASAEVLDAGVKAVLKA